MRLVGAVVDMMKGNGKGPKRLGSSCVSGWMNGANSRVYVVTSLMGPDYGSFAEDGKYRKSCPLSKLMEGDLRAKKKVCGEGVRRWPWLKMRQVTYTIQLKKSNKLVKVGTLYGTRGPCTAG